MYRVVIFGFGELGKKIVDECLDYESNYSIVAILDNNISQKMYRGIQLKMASDIKGLIYDEIWITTVYFNEIIEQLTGMGIPREKMRFVEPVVPLIEERLKKSGVLERKQYETESRYILQNHLRMYPYDVYDEYLYKKSYIEFDEEAGMFYGIYNGHKMYLARRFNTEQKARAYFNAVTMEQDHRSPHCYWNNEPMLNQTGIAIDVGAAEGIYGLKIINQIDHLYMIEVDEEWIEALHYTYEMYKDKITIIKKFISSFDDDRNAKLDTLFNNIKIDSIKMDIEGAEIDALLGADSLLNRCKPMLAVCVYHHKDDNTRIKSVLTPKGYVCNNSQGYVICQGDWELDLDEAGFRRALLFATVK